jgi:hypothetical protein
MTTSMTTARTALGGLLALALLPAFWPGEAAAHSCDAPFTTDLVTARASTSARSRSATTRSS